MRYIRCQSCGSQNKQSDPSCYSCHQPLEDSTAPTKQGVTAEVAVSAEAVPKALAEVYDIEAADGLVIMRARQSRRIALGTLLGLMGCFWLSALLVIPGLTAVAIIICLLMGLGLVFVGVRMAITRVIFTLARGRIERRRESPFGASQDDFSGARMMFWRSNSNGTGTSYRLYLLQPGENLGPFSAVFGEGFRSDTHKDLEAWMVAVTGLRSLLAK